MSIKLRYPFLAYLVELRSEVRIRHQVVLWGPRVSIHRIFICGLASGTRQALGH
jgi:hypothetical protein